MKTRGEIADEIEKWADRLIDEEGPARVIADVALGGVLKTHVREIIAALRGQIEQTAA